MTMAVLALGSNLGDRYAHLSAAVEGLKEVTFAVSGVYETPPWTDGSGADDPAQPAYLNAVVIGVDAAEDPWLWLARARELEAAAGRQRDPAWRFGPRTLDVDVIAIWDAAGEPITQADPDLTLPHPRAHLRAFVLRPWLDIQPYALLAGHGFVYDLIRADPVAGDLPGLTPRPDLPLDGLR
jgi:2-amino-4-hydroxy-6-hydroxymethyldihydropteridine diphosphokinase